MVDSELDSSVQNSTVVIVPVLFNKTSTTTIDNDRSSPSPDYIYVTGEVIVAFVSVLGNTLVIYVFCHNKKLRVYRNYYIFALAVADLLVGLIAIPLAIVASLGLPRDFYGCLFTCSFVVVLCLVSILCLLAVSADRFWATFDPLSYYRNMSINVVRVILASCIILGSILGLLPFFGWYNPTGWQGESCIFPNIMDFNYLAFIYFVAIILPALIMAGFYWRIYRFAQDVTRRKTQGGPGHDPRLGSTDILSRTEVESQDAKTERTQRKEARAGKKLGSIIVFFLVCWMPLNTMNCVKAFCKHCGAPLIVVRFAIILSHINSAVNPLLYAFHLKKFRVAMKSALSSLLTTIISCRCRILRQKDSQQITVTTKNMNQDPHKL